MREHKYRAWEKNLKQIIPVYNIDFEKKMINTDSAWRMFNEIELLEWTGLYDKNNNEIYEGYIVKADEHIPENYLIEFIEGGFCGTHPKVNGYPTDINHFYSSIGCSIEIIGNIYENPELLKI